MLRTPLQINVCTKTMRGYKEMAILLCVVTGSTRANHILNTLISDAQITHFSNPEFEIFQIQNHLNGATHS